MPLPASTLHPPRILPAFGTHPLYERESTPPSSGLLPAGRQVPPPSSRSLTPAQFGARFGLSPDTIYRYIQTGWIDQRFVTLAGPRKIQIDETAVAWFREECRRRRDA